MNCYLCNLIERLHGMEFESSFLIRCRPEDLSNRLQRIETSWREDSDALVAKIDARAIPAEHFELLKVNGYVVELG